MGVDEKIGNILAVPSGVAGTEVIREKLLIGFSLVELASSSCSMLCLLGIR